MRLLLCLAVSAAFLISIFTAGYEGKPFSKES